MSEAFHSSIFPSILIASKKKKKNIRRKTLLAASTFRFTITIIAHLHSLYKETSSSGEKASTPDTGDELSEKKYVGDARLSLTLNSQSREDTLKGE